MTTKKEIEEAVQRERDRCAGLMDAYRQDFENSPDEMMASLWCRIRNQITLGVDPENSDFGSQFSDEDDEHV